MIIGNMAALFAFRFNGFHLGRFAVGRRVPSFLFSCPVPGVVVEHLVTLLSVILIITVLIEYLRVQVVIQVARLVRAVLWEHLYVRRQIIVRTVVEVCLLLSPVQYI